MKTYKDANGVPRPSFWDSTDEALFGHMPESSFTRPVNDIKNQKTLEEAIEEKLVDSSFNKKRNS